MNPEPADSSRRNFKAKVALGLSLLALAALALFVFGVLVEPSWISDNDWVWFLLLWVAVLAGIVAAFLGSLGWIDVRRGVTSEGLVQSKIGSILGGTVAALVVGFFLAIVIVLMYVFENVPVD